jgi:hypothetical protein
MGNLLPQERRVKSPRRPGRVRGSEWEDILEEKALMKCVMPSERKF